MMEFLEAVRDSGFATWMRGEGYFPYTFVLALHAIGLAFLVGTNAAIDLRILGFAPDLPVRPLEKYFRIMWVSFWISLVSGVCLYFTEPQLFFVNWLMWVKLGLIAFAVWNIRLLRAEVFGHPANVGTGVISAKGKMLAATSLAAWFLAIIAGRTESYVFSTDDQIAIPLATSLAVLIVSAIMMLVAYSASRLFSSNGAAGQASEQGV